MRILVPFLAVLTLQAANAQPPVPPEVTEMIAEIEQDTGVTRFGATHLGELDDGDKDAVEVTVDPAKLTFLAIEGADYTLGIKVHAFAGSKEVAASVADIPNPVLQIPAGNGARIRLDLEMSCEEIACQYFVQAFVR